MLATTFQLITITETSSIPFEIEIHNEIRNILQNYQDVNSVSFFEHDYMLDFAMIDPSEPHGAQDVNYITSVEKEKDESSEFEECVVDNKGGAIDFSYKRKAVKFWKSEKRARRPLTSVQKIFRKVKSLHQLYKGETSVEKGGTNADKIAFIMEYVLQKFNEACDIRSIIHDMNLRLWDLEASKSIRI